jgi:hypothetical protein
MVTAGLALVALAAFALPAVASATTNPTITEPTGTVLNPTGKTCTTGLPGICVTATNIGSLKFKSGGSTLFECTTASFTGSLSINSGAATEATIVSAAFGGTAAGGACTTASFGNLSIDTNIGNGTPWCLRSTSTMAADEFQIRGNSCASESRSITLVFTFSGSGTCKYNRAAAITGTYKTDTSPENSDAILSLAAGANTEITKEEGGILCPTAFQLEISYTLETDTTPTSDPLYIS